MKKTIKIAIIVTLIITFTVIALATRQQTTGLEFSPKKSNNVSGPIVIKAKDDIKQGNGMFTITPNISYSIQVIDNYIIVWPEQELGFVEKTEYTAVFSDYKTDKGEGIDLTIKFNIDRNKSYEKLQTEVLEKYGNLEISSNPFLEQLPYDVPLEFSITYSYVNDEDRYKPVHEVLGDETNWKTKKNNYVVYINTYTTQGANESIEEYKQNVISNRESALEWIKSQGVDVKNDINYIFIPSDEDLDDPNFTETESLIIDEIDY